MQFIAAVLLAAAALSNAQSVPTYAPGCVKYCLRTAREQSPGACSWAGWCATSGFEDSVNTCLDNICGSTNQQVGRDIYQQICSQAGTNTACPSSVGGSATSAATSATSEASVTSASAATSTASEASTSDLITTTIGGVATTIPASATSSIASEASTSSAIASASSVSASVESSISSAISTATAPVSSAISSILSSASSAAASASSAASSPSQTSNAATAIGLPISGQFASVGAILIGVAAGALML